MAIKETRKSRQEITDSKSENAQELENLERELEEDAQDAEIERRTLAALRGGTAEGIEQVSTHVTSAEHQTVNHFESEDQKVEAEQSHNEQLQAQDSERYKSAEDDSHRIRDARTEMKKEGAKGEMRRARESSTRDMDFSRMNREELAKRRQESESLQQKYRNIIRKG